MQNIYMPTTYYTIKNDCSLNNSEPLLTDQNKAISRPTKIVIIIIIIIIIRQEYKCKINAMFWPKFDENGTNYFFPQKYEREKFAD
jgi:hypothetical protein